MNGVVAINVQDTWLVQATDQTPHREFTARVTSLYPLGAQISADCSNS